MALLFMDSFDHYATADLLEKWTAQYITGSGATLTVNSAAGRHGSSGARCSYHTGTGSMSTQLAKTVPAVGATFIIGMSIKTDVIPAGGGTAIMQIWDGATIQLTLVLQNDMRLQVKRGQINGTNLGGSSSISLSLNLTYYIEFKVFIDPTAGTVEVRVDEVPVITLINQNTRNSTAAQWTAFLVGVYTLNGVSNAANKIDIDDLYVCDGSGPAPWNSFLGDCRVDVRQPTAAGATTGWTPLAGANWDAVNDAAPDDDATYVAAPAAGVVDTYVVQDAPVVGGTLYGIQHCLAMKKLDAGICAVAPVVRHAGLDYVALDLSPSTAYAFSHQIGTINPGTGLAWTEAGFNAAEFGFKRTA